MVKDYDEMELVSRIPEDLVYENQTISNDFIFGKVMQDKGLCTELLELLTGKILLFNTKGSRVNVPPKVKEFLDYIETKKSTNTFTDKVDMAVNKVRQNKEWRLEYMKTLLHDMDVRLEGEEIGREKGKIELLVSKIVTKIQKGKSVEKIAEELEENEDYIKKIYDIATKDEVGCDIERILKEINIL